jgi:hypothetical protein
LEAGEFGEEVMGSVFAGHAALYIRAADFLSHSFLSVPCLGRQTLGFSLEEIQ